MEWRAQILYDILNVKETIRNVDFIQLKSLLKLNSSKKFEKM
jgi:hypothetical protein